MAAWIMPAADGSANQGYYLQLVQRLAEELSLRGLLQRRYSSLRHHGTGIAVLAQGSLRMPPTHPPPVLSKADAVFIIVGIVIGAGIFKAPSLVAANTASDLTMLALWLAGGALALIGALCYAELSSTYPDTGGDYHFLRRAFGPHPAFLFAWARLSVMQTGSIALLAYVFGDYAAQLLPAGEHAAAIYAALAVVVFTLINMRGIRQGTGTQRAFTVVEVAGVVAIIVLCLALGTDAAAPAQSVAATAPASAGTSASLGLALVFVLLTYGGWNEAAYVSSELRSGRTAIVRALIVSIAIITALYVFINFAYLAVLGHSGMAASEAVAADAMRAILGERGAQVVSLLVAISALTSINATIITGARCNHALGRDFPALGFLSYWNSARGSPAAGFIIQGVVALLLVGLGAAGRSGFATLVEYTAPVFWLFFLTTGLALLRLRRSDPYVQRPFRVPLYPWIPLIFCASSAYMLWSSLSYTGFGALVGVAVLAAGIPILWFVSFRQSLYQTGHAHERSDTAARLAGGHRALD
jgi:amino acid transporter